MNRSKRALRYDERQVIFYLSRLARKSCTWRIYQRVKTRFYTVDIRTVIFLGD